MSIDESRRGLSRPKQISRVALPHGPAAVFRDFLYELYLRAGPPTLDEIVRRIGAAEAEDPDVLGVPGRDVIHQMVSGKALPAQLPDAVTVARLLARMGGGDPNEADRQIRELLIVARMPPARLGRPIADCSPIDLEVHRAIELPDHDTGLPILPAYVPRAHDARLREAVQAASDGHSRLVTVVGGSSTGKTRACWEAIQPLAERPEPWRLWHPFDPFRTATATALADVGPYTVVWLNEAQHYLLTSNPELGERIAAGLRSLLTDPHRGRVLILATMWPTYWTTATVPPPPDRPDTHAQARQLLVGTDLSVTETFTATDLRALHMAADGDPRLLHAADHAEEGRITQHLAGVPELVSRYRNAEPAARAILHVAIDARRLGHPLALPYTLLEHAAPGYLADQEWDSLGEDWLEQALAYTATPRRGVRGPLTRIRARPNTPSSEDQQPPTASRTTSNRPAVHNALTSTRPTACGLRSPLSSLTQSCSTGSQSRPKPGAASSTPSRCTFTPPTAATSTHCGPWSCCGNGRGMPPGPRPWPSGPPTAATSVHCGTWPGYQGHQVPPGLRRCSMPPIAATPTHRGPWPCCGNGRGMPPGPRPWPCEPPTAATSVCCGTWPGFGNRHGMVPVPRPSIGKPPTGCAVLRRDSDRNSGRRARLNLVR